MGTAKTDEFCKDAVRIALTSGLSRRQIADDLGVGMSMLNKWITAHRDTDVVSHQDRELALENEHLRRENRILREERNIPRKACAVSNRMKRNLAIRALKMAIALLSPPRGCTFHSDRGSQCCSLDYQKILRENGFRASMSGKGNCYDNAAVLRRENSPLDCFLTLLTFFKTIKTELNWRRPWLFCTNPVMNSSCESSMVAGRHEQTHAPPPTRPGTGRPTTSH